MKRRRGGAVRSGMAVVTALLLLPGCRKNGTGPSEVKPPYPKVLVATIALGGGEALSLDITPDGEEVWVNNDEQGFENVWVISTTALEVTRKVPVSGHDVGELRITADGNFVYFCVDYGDHGIVELNTVTYQQTRTLSLHENGNPIGPGGFGLAITPANDVIYAAHYASPGYHGCIAKFSVPSGGLLDSISINHACDVDLNNAGDRLYAVSEELDLFYEIEPTDLTVVNALAVGTDPEFIAITDDDAYAFITHLNDARIFVIDLIEFTVAATLDLGAHGLYGGQFAGLTPNEDYLFVCSGGSGNIYVVDVSDPTSPTFVENLDFCSDLGGLNDIRFSSDGSRAYVGDNQGNVGVLEKPLSIE